MKHLITKIKSVGCQNENLNVKFICKLKTEKRRRINEKEAHEEKRAYHCVVER